MGGFVVGGFEGLFPLPEGFAVVEVPGCGCGFAGVGAVDVVDEAAVVDVDDFFDSMSLLRISSCSSSSALILSLSACSSSSSS